MIISIDVGEKNFAYCIGDPNRVVAWKRHDVKSKKSQTVLESCIKISTILDNENQLIDQCWAVVIEQQMMTNLRAKLIAQHLWSYFKTKYPGKVVKFIPASRKTQHFLGKNNLDARQRKKWSIDKVCELMKDNEEMKALFENVEGKKDDICDAYLQMIVFLQKN